MNKKATFIHNKYGEWKATPNNVISKFSGHPKNSIKKAQQTFMKKYGVIHPLKNEKIFKKTQKSRWDTVVVSHWKTNEELVCRASYEYGVVKKLNQKRIDYKWQIKFTLSNKSVYYCDLYLIKEKKYVEIKGIFWSIKNKEKWDVFKHSTKNAELWMRKEVELFVGKPIAKIRKEFKEEINAKKAIK